MPRHPSRHRLGAIVRDDRPIRRGQPAAGQGWSYATMVTVIDVSDSILVPGRPERVESFGRLK